MTKIGKLEQHCGECGVIDFCGNAYGYCLCYDERFENVSVKTYEKIAENAPALKEYDECKGCTRPDCGIYRYSETDFEDEECEYNDEARDYWCEQIADYVETKLKERK